jgi:hypothetical protein
MKGGRKLPVLWKVGGEGDEDVRGRPWEEGQGGRKYRLARLRETGRRELVTSAGE